jgi:multiple sugar transport system permease protein
MAARRFYWYKERLIPYLFILPAFIGLCIFKLWPIAESLLSSFRAVDFGSGGGSVRWVGFANYAFIFSDDVFWTSFRVTMIFSVLINPFQVAAALILAMLVNRKLPGINFFRTAFFMPITTSLAIASTIWGLMLNPNNGLINSFLSFLRIPPQPFLTSSSQAIYAVIILMSWRGIGYWMIFLLAGIQQIPSELYEAAMMDGSRGFNLFRYITLPLIRRTLAFVLVADTSVNFLIFVPMYMLTQGGPELSTNVLMYEAFRNVFIYGDRGVGNAIVMFILLITLIVVGIELLFLRSEK